MNNEQLEKALQTLTDAQRTMNKSICDYLDEVAQEKGSKELFCKVGVKNPHDPNDIVIIDYVEVNGANTIYHSCTGYAIDYFIGDFDPAEEVYLVQMIAETAVIGIKNEEGKV